MTDRVALVRLLEVRTLDDSVLARCTAMLDDSERQRLARFVRRERRNQFIAGRVLARRTLGAVLGVAPEAVRLVERPGAAPALAMPAAGAAGFSISHSGLWIACAASATGRVGLDVEVVDPARDIAVLAPYAFDASQQAWLAARPTATRVSDFYRAWSTLEARFKLGTVAAATFDLSRPGLAIVVCSEHALTAPPAVESDRL
ncbi:4'-phosphopantetheinyl transferase family protein [Massilia sp. GER05]|uniref:4'-phosphopantetheinyl transferase family protein n=1 Tax=unclassified Massilia TaxID=2609279 RepID=UPI0039B04D40